MGGGTWNDSTYIASAAARAMRGEDDFAYSRSQAYIPRDQRKAAPELDPAGVAVREARDSAEHPNSTPIAVLFDVTGSMRSVPVTVQQKLSDLLGLLARGGYADDPQIMVGAIGDCYYDSVPLQVGQFESDNRIDEQLRRIYLEGGGGGDKREGYALAAHFLATRGQTDSWDKRGRKGYAFFIGDEMNKRTLTAEARRRWLGEEAREDMEIEEVYRRLAERWHVFYILPNMTSYWNDPEIEEHWRPLVGERFLRLDDPSKVAELIAATVGLVEGSVTVAEAVADTGSDSVGRALARVESAGAVQSADALLPADL